MKNYSIITVAEFQQNLFNWFKLNCDEETLLENWSEIVNLNVDNISDIKISEANENMLSQYLENLFSSFMISGDNYDSKLQNDFKNQIEATWEFVDFDDQFTPQKRISSFNTIEDFTFLGGYTSANRSINEPENLSNGEQIFFFVLYWNNRPRVHVFVNEGRLPKSELGVFDEDAIVQAIYKNFIL